MARLAPVLLGLVLNLFFFVGRTQADEAGTAELIKQLDADAFKEREAASRKLAETGKAAIPALTETVLRGRPEPASRAFEILKEHFQNGDDATKAAAKEALESIVQEGRQIMVSQARNLLDPQPQSRSISPFAPAGIALNGAKRMTVKTVNGVKEIEVDEADRKIKISDDPKNGIKMEVAETKNGKTETKKYYAKSADELKKKHPDAHELYEKYGKGNPAIQVRAGAIRLPLNRNAIPVLPNAKKVSVKEVNGVKEIEAEEDGRKVKINDDPNKGIKVEITESKDGKETTKKYEAKSADELKKMHPDAHELYEKYNKGNAIIQIQVNGPIQIQAREIQIPIPQP